jgi:ABC-type sugar transport system ATPase subunit
MPEIRMEALRREHPGPKGTRVTALRDVTLSVSDGELLGVVGPSGSGKTTLLRLVAGLDRPDSGAVWIGGRAAAGLTPPERGVAMVMQDHPLFPHLDVRANLELAPRLAGVSREERERRVARVATVLGLEPLLTRRPQELSGGERQRVGLGGALATGARVLLLDEPLAQLDSPTRARMRIEIRRVQREFGATVIHVTHDQAEALALADRLAVLREGGLEHLGTPREVYGQPATLFVAGFLGAPAMNLWPGRLGTEPGAAGFQLEGGGVIHLRPDILRPGRSDGPLVLGVRPEALVPGRGSGWLEGGVESVEWLGHETLVRLSPGGPGGATAVVRLPVGTEAGWVPGATGTVGFGPGSVHWFGAGTGRRLGVSPKERG